MLVRKTSAAAALAVVGVFVVLAGVAWPCTPSPGILTVGPQVASPGSDVTVRGEAMRPRAPVELRWNAPRGPVIGVVTTDSKGAFAASVAVPPSSPGVYYVIAATPAGLTRAQVDLVAASGEASGLRSTEAATRAGGSSRSGSVSYGGFLALIAAGVGGVTAMGVAVSGRRRALARTAAGRN